MCGNFNGFEALGCKEASLSIYIQVKLPQEMSVYVLLHRTVQINTSKIFSSYAKIYVQYLQREQVEEAPGPWAMLLLSGTAGWNEGGNRHEHHFKVCHGIATLHKFPKPLW